MIVLGSKKNKLNANAKYGKMPIWNTIELNKWKNIEAKNLIILNGTIKKVGTTEKNNKKTLSVLKNN